MLHLILGETNEYLTGLEGDQELQSVQQDLSYLHQSVRNRQNDATDGRTEQGCNCHSPARQDNGNRHPPRRRRTCLVFKRVRDDDAQGMAWISGRTWHPAWKGISLASWARAHLLNKVCLIILTSEVPNLAKTNCCPGCCKDCKCVSLVEIMRAFHYSENTLLMTFV